MRTCLALESSTSNLSIALKEDKAEMREVILSNIRRHEEHLFKPLQELLGSLKNSLNGILVGTGPGSYGGCRVAIAAANALSLVYNCPVIGIPSLYAIEPSLLQESICFAGNARRDSGWIWKFKEQVLDENPCLLDWKDWEVQVNLQQIKLCSLEPMDRWSIDNEMKNRIELVVPKARFLLSFWEQLEPLQRQCFYTDLVEPIYLRPPHITQPKSE